VVSFRPLAAYLCRGTPAGYARAAALPFVRDVVALTGELKPAVRTAEDGECEVAVTAVAVPGDEERVLATLAAVGGIRVRPGSPEPAPVGVRVRVTAGPGGADRLRQVPAVLAVERYEERRKEDEAAAPVVAGRLDPAGLDPR
jgi:hypothetical protein